MKVSECMNRLDMKMCLHFRALEGLCNMLDEDGTRDSIEFGDTSYNQRPCLDSQKDPLYSSLYRPRDKKSRLCISS